MINGIDVLSKTELTTYADWCLPLALTISAIVFVLVLILLLVGDDWDDFLPCALFSFLVGGILFILLALFFTGVTDNIPTGKYEYKVTISDDVNFNEFDEKYDLIDTDGEIYIIRDKDVK